MKKWGYWDGWSSLTFWAMEKSWCCPTLIIEAGPLSSWNSPCLLGRVPHIWSMPPSPPSLLYHLLFLLFLLLLPSSLLFSAPSFNVGSEGWAQPSWVISLALTYSTLEFCLPHLLSQAPVTLRALLSFLRHKYEENQVLSPPHPSSTWHDLTRTRIFQSYFHQV